MAATTQANRPLHRTCTYTCTMHISTRCTMFLKASSPRRKSEFASGLWQKAVFVGTALALFLCLSVESRAGELQPVRIAGNGRGFVAGGKKFVPWGFNYDHDE